MLFKKTKDNFIYIVLSFFLIGNMFLINQAFYLKKLLIISFFVIAVSACFFQKGKLERIIRYFIYFNNDKVVKKISGIMSLLSLLFFILSLFSLNMGLIWFARWLILIFIINVVVSGIFVFFDLERSGHIVFNKMKFVFGSAVSLLYLITSTYAASYFMQFSNMDVSDSPLLEFGWKLAFFTIYFFMILQPVSYFVFLSISNKLIGHQLITFFGILMVTSLLLFAVPRWAENFIVLVLDWATSSEWHNSAMCGSLRISDSTERYFGFNTDKYTVYFSNRDGKWGFEELQCAKDDKNQDSFTRVLVEQSNMPQWFEE